MERYTGNHERVGTYISGLLTTEIPETGEVVYIGPAAQRLKEYEDLGLTPEQLMEIDKLYAEKCREAEELKRKSTNAGWIPCSERLPEPTRPVLVTLRNWTNEKLFVRQGRFHIDHWRTDEGIVENSVVIAWQPLPEPYQPKGE